MGTGSEPVDVFTSSWADENNWCFSHVYLIPVVIRHAQNLKLKVSMYFQDQEKARISNSVKLS